MYQTVDDLFQAAKVKLEDLYPGIICSLEVVSKNNDVKLNSLQARMPEQNVVPTIYLDSYVDEINYGGLSMTEAVEDVIKEYTLRLGVMLKPEINRETAKENLFCTVVSKEKNAEMLQRGVPYRNVPGTDLVTVMRFRCDIGNGVYGSFLVKEDTLGMMSLTSDEAFNIAYKTTLEEDMRIQSMADVLLGLDDMPEEIKNEINTEELIPMYVVTNSNALNGAVQAFIGKERLEAIQEKIGTETFYIIPSSIHEVLCVPGDMDYETLTEMVQEVNATMVRPDEILSDNVYFCNEHLQLSIPGMTVDEKLQTVSERLSAGIHI